LEGKEMKVYTLYVLFNKKTKMPYYIGLSGNLTQRLQQHKSKGWLNFVDNDVYFIETFESKREALAAERCLIKFFSIFPNVEIRNGLYVNLGSKVYYKNLPR